MESINRCVTPTTTNGISTTTPSSTGSTYGLFKKIDTTPSPLTPNLSTNRVSTTTPGTSTQEAFTAFQILSDELTASGTFPPSFFDSHSSLNQMIPMSKNDSISLLQEEHKTTEQELNDSIEIFYRNSEDLPSSKRTKNSSSDT